MYIVISSLFVLLGTDLYTLLRFKSCNDDGKRYTPHTVKNVSESRKVDRKDLKDMVIDKPRKPKDPAAPAKPTTSSSSKKARKRSSKRSSKKPTDTSIEKGESGKLKDLYQKTFQTTTLTLGSLSGCLRRATELSSDDIRKIVARIDAATDILNKARIMVYKSLELFILDSLRSQPAPGMIEDPQHIDPLDLILSKQDGETVIRNLIALMLNGKIAGGRPPKKDSKASRARTLAQSIYNDMRTVLPDLNPVKGSLNIPLSIPQSELAREIHTSLRTHFSRLPETIISRVGATSSIESCTVTDTSNSNLTL